MADSTHPIAEDEQLANVLDDVITAYQAGQAVNCAELRARHPELADALDLLARIGGDSSTAGGNSLHPLPRSLPERIGPYRIEGELGAGSFGLVYRAYDPHIRRHVALKLLHPG